MAARNAEKIAPVKDYCITGRANLISVQLAFAKFLSKIKVNF